MRAATGLLLFAFLYTAFLAAARPWGGKSRHHGGAPPPVSSSTASTASATPAMTTLKLLRGSLRAKIDDCSELECGSHELCQVNLTKKCYGDDCSVKSKAVVCVASAASECGDVCAQGEACNCGSVPTIIIRQKKNASASPRAA